MEIPQGKHTAKNTTSRILPKLNFQKVTEAKLPRKGKKSKSNTFFLYLKWYRIIVVIDNALFLLTLLNLIMAVWSVLAHNTYVGLPERRLRDILWLSKFFFLLSAYTRNIPERISFYNINNMLQSKNQLAVATNCEQEVNACFYKLLKFWCHFLLTHHSLTHVN